VPLARSHSFHVLTCPSLCALQEVSTPCSLAFFFVSSLVRRCALPSGWVLLARSHCFCVLTCPLLCAPQEVSAPRSHSSHVLTCPSLCALQSVSAPHSLTFSPCPHLSITLCYPASECPSLARFLSVSSHVVTLCSPVCECPSLARFLSTSSLVCHPAFSRK
jgi:hypothetical protein